MAIRLRSLYNPVALVKADIAESGPPTSSPTPATNLHYEGPKTHTLEDKKPYKVNPDAGQVYGQR